MSRVAPTPALARLRGEFPSRAASRVVLHRGTCGDAVGAEGAWHELRGMLGERLVEGACDGACWAAPAATVQREGHVHRFPHLDRGIPGALADCADGHCDDDFAGRGEYGLLELVGRNDGSLEDVVARGGFSALAHACALRPDQILDAVEALGLTGRGGAHFQTAQKWRLAARHEGARYLVVNAEEGEPGVFKDRHLLEGDAYRLIEGILIACRAVGIGQVYVYINGQARYAWRALEAALEECARHGITDGSTLGNDPVEIDVRSGAGGYVCGEESVILNSIEGERPVPRYRPPFATDAGLWGRPTVINNVETLCAVTTAFDSPPPPTKVLSLSGSVPRPGLYEVPVDGNTTWAGVLAMAGALPGIVPAILLGGPSGRLVTPEEFEEPLTMRGLGAGGTVVLPRDADIAEVTRSLARYNMRESCGECTPCREGTPRLAELLEDPAIDHDRIRELIEVMAEGSLCQLGGMAGRPVASALESFPEAFDER